jgi:aspartyl/asparaginyl-tRNA synthetase
MSDGELMSHTIPDLNKLHAPSSWRDPGSHLEVALRDPWYRGVIALQDGVSRATVAFWHSRGVRAAHLPITTGAVSSPMGLGSDSTAVEVDLAGVPTFLADSMQFGLEFACRLNETGSYYLMPSFRGENCDESHLSQFFHSEAEVPGSLDDVMVLVEDYVRFVSASLLEESSDLIARCAGTTAHVEALVDRPGGFERLTFDEAVAVLDGFGVTTGPSGAWRSLSRQAERRLLASCGQFVWITHWDDLAVPFYQAVDGGKALNGDLLFGVGETVGAGERHSSAIDVRCALRRHGVAEESYAWYLRMKEIAPLQTAGFGMGVERYLMWLLAAGDIRDLQLMLRDNGSVMQP